MKRYSKEFKDEALRLSDEIVVKKAAASSVWNATPQPTGADIGKLT